ncbi:MAG: LCP family protein [Chloroflexota bacterium]
MRGRPLLASASALLVVLAVAVVAFGLSSWRSLPGTANRPGSGGVETAGYPNGDTAQLRASSAAATDISGLPAGNGNLFALTQEEAKGRLTILLLGIDQKEWEREEPARSDSIIVVSIDPESKRVAMISIPRDLYVEIPGFGFDRINAANAFGDANGYPGGGPALAMDTIEHNFGLHIDYYARIDFQGFQRLVDSLGGVTVNVERPIYDTHYPADPARGYTTISIPAGVQQMDGRVALQYARSRFTENDFGRARRQQILLMAIRDRAMQIDAIPKLPALLGTMMDMAETNVPLQESMRLARLANDIDQNRVRTLVIDDNLATPFTGEGGAYLLEPKMAEINQAMAAAINGE